MAFRRIALSLVVAALAIAACSEGGGGDSGISIDEPVGAPAAGSDYSGDASESTSAAPPAPSVVKNADIDIDVVENELNSAAQQVVDLVTSPRIGGFLVAALVDTEEGHGSGNVVVEVPSSEFEHVVGELATVGQVTRQQLQGEDLSPEARATQTGLQRTRARIVGLLRRLDRAEDEAVRFELRQELEAARSELESLRRDESSIDLSTSYSTIDVDLTGTPAPGPPERPAFERALATAKNITLAIVSGAILAAGVIVPIGALLFLLYIAAAPVVRRFKSRLKTEPL